MNSPPAVLPATTTPSACPPRATHVLLAAMPPRAKPPADLESIVSAIPKVFEQVQSTTANHQKNSTALYKLQCDAATHTLPVQNGKSIKIVGERAFEDAILDMLARVLPIKKGITVADRVIKFIGGYTRFINEKGESPLVVVYLFRWTQCCIEMERADTKDEEEETTASRFVTRILRFLLSGCVAKDKNVRYRVLQTIAEMIAHLGEIEYVSPNIRWRLTDTPSSEDMYSLLRSSLMERVRDREPPIRVQAIIALSKLAGSEDISDVQDGEQTIIEVLVDALTYDTSPYVIPPALYSYL